MRALRVCLIKEPAFFFALAFGRIFYDLPFSSFRSGGKDKTDRVWKRNRNGLEIGDELDYHKALASEQGWGRSSLAFFFFSLFLLELFCLYIFDKFTIETMTTVSPANNKRESQTFARAFLFSLCVWSSTLANHIPTLISRSYPGYRLSTRVREIRRRN